MKTHIDLKFIFYMIIILLFFYQKGIASNILGGEITWECHTSGKYIFKMKVYTNCDTNSGAPQYRYANRILRINGSSLPTDSFNQAIQTISLKPDSIAIVSQQAVEVPNCSGVPSYSCSNGEIGPIQVFYYVSDPIYMKGSPPLGGWQFVYGDFCCRANTENLQIGRQQVLTSTMYPDTTSLSVYPCVNNSPRFIAPVSQIHCRGLVNTVSYTALDEENDSLDYQFSMSFNSPLNSPIAANYQSGYSYNNPTPDYFFNSFNQPATLDYTSGLMHFKIQNGVGQGVKAYHVAVRVDAYSNGILNASVIREYPIYLLDCPTLTNGGANTPPQVFGANVLGSAINLTDTVTVGNLLTSSFSISDSNQNNQQAQGLTFEVFSDEITLDYSMNAACLKVGDTSCASISSSISPVYDTTLKRYVFKNNGSINGTLNWRPSCADLGPNNSARKHYFILKAQDDHCPVPAVQYEVLEITVLPDPNNPCGTITSIIDGEPLNERISIFPNPTNGLVNVKLTQKEQLEVSIRNLQGKLVNQFIIKNKSNFRFQIDGPAGIYFLELSNREGESVNKKIVTL